MIDLLCDVDGYIDAPIDAVFYGRVNDDDDMGLRIVVPCRLTSTNMLYVAIINCAHTVEDLADNDFAYGVEFEDDKVLRILTGLGLLSYLRYVQIIDGTKPLTLNECIDMRIRLFNMVGRKLRFKQLTEYSGCDTDKLGLIAIDVRTLSIIAD